MDMEKVRRILNTCDLLLGMSSGGGWVDTYDIKKWSGIANATTYRYLVKMVKLGFLEIEKRPFQNKQKSFYKITKSGQEYLYAFNQFGVVEEMELVS